MSDFDKEAEREKLREKYEADRESRETAEKMSELLLQGATMTNAHCSECGDPIFRYDGQEFCATCEKPVDRGTDDADETDAAGAADDGTGTDRTDEDGRGESDRIEVTSPSDDARVQFGTDESGAEGSGADDPGATASEAPDSSSEGATARGSTAAAAGRRDDADRVADEAAGTGRQPATPPAGHERDRGTRDERAGAGTGDLAAARHSLARTLRRFSERAEAADDPGRAREHLAAAREAAEALSALRR
jgi:uncharacterized Zn finger protein (UPF0148 family)